MAKTKVQRGTLLTDDELRLKLAEATLEGFRAGYGAGIRDGYVFEGVSVNGVGFVSDPKVPNLLASKFLIHDPNRGNYSINNPAGISKTKQ